MTHDQQVRLWNIVEELDEMDASARRIDEDAERGARLQLINDDETLDLMIGLLRDLHEATFAPCRTCGEVKPRTMLDFGGDCPICVDIARHRNH